jgi:hypothetical protein
MRDGLVRSGEFGEDAANAAAAGARLENEVVGEKVKLAALLPGVARWTHLALNGVPNEIIEVSLVIFLCCWVVSELGMCVVGFCRTQRSGWILGYRAFFL